MDSIEKELEIMKEYEDKLEILNKYFPIEDLPSKEVLNWVKKILLLSDDLRLSSGVGTMSKEIVFGTIHKYDWFSS